jgi:hypothetical protein
LGCIGDIGIVRGNHDTNLEPLLPENIKLLPATGAIIGNMQKVTALAILPLFVNAAYKVYLRFFKLRFFPGELGVLQRNGTIRSRYDKSYTIINFLLRRGRFTEKQLVLVMIGIEALFCIVSLLIFY